MKHLPILLMVFLFLFSSSVTAQTPTGATAGPDRFASCDLCGYCPGSGSKPSTWEQCRACIYPQAAGDNDTLKIDPETNNPPTPMPGRYFTSLGCLKTSANDFTASGAAGNVVQVLLNTIISISGGIAFLYFIYGSFLVLTSQADPEKLNHGRRVLVGAIIGLLFVLGSVFITNLIGSGILKIPGFTSGP